MIATYSWADYELQRNLQNWGEIALDRIQPTLAKLAQMRSPLATTSLAIFGLAGPSASLTRQL